MQRYKSQSAVPGASMTPMSGAAKTTMSSSKPKDLTDTLMSQVGCGPCSRVFAFITYGCVKFARLVTDSVILNQ